MAAQLRGGAAALFGQRDRRRAFSRAESLLPPVSADGADGATACELKIRTEWSELGIGRIRTQAELAADGRDANRSVLARDPG